MIVLNTCKNEEDAIKNEGDRVFTRFSHYNPMGAIYCYENQSFNRIWPKT